MKIISKFTDYYDHEIAYFGYDDSRVYDRRNKTPIGHMGTNIQFFICGEIIPVAIKNNRIYFNESKDLDWRDNEFIRRNKNLPTDVNQKSGMPVAIESGEFVDGKYAKVYKVPILANYAFPSIIPSREMYSMIYDYLGWLKDNPPAPDNQTNKGKIISHGFDVKKSFRPKMK